MREPKSAGQIFKESGGGLYIDLKPGDFIEVDHDGEKIKITLCGKHGSFGKTMLGINGSKNFKIQRFHKNKIGGQNT